MRAAVYHEFKDAIQSRYVPDPEPSATGVVIKVKATGICRSDWWGWQGYDPDIHLPHVPGHELAGEILEVGSDVRRWKPGDRVTVPFVSGCGKCDYCKSGNQQVCDHQFQPGFTAWGSFAEFVNIEYADENLVRLPDEMSFTDAASLGCRFITSFRALVHQAKLIEDEWLAVHGCGGVGLSAILIGKALGSRVIAVDISTEKLDFARSLGADACFNVQPETNELEEIRELTGGGAHVSIDAFGSKETCIQSIKSLKKRGRHVQVGLMEGTFQGVPLPMNLITGYELEIYGSHGMQAARYPEIFSLIQNGKLYPGSLVTNIVDLGRGIQILTDMDRLPPLGIAVIDMEK